MRKNEHARKREQEREGERKKTKLTKKKSTK